MKTTQTLNAHEYNTKLATALKKEKAFEQPEWLMLVKSGSGKVRPIEDEDFWYKRGASILRQINVRGSIGVQRLRTRYGNRKDRGKQPAHFAKSSGKIVRLFLQQAEAAGLVAKATGKAKGRMLTDKGKKLLESIN